MQSELSPVSLEWLKEVLRHVRDLWQLRWLHYRDLSEHIPSIVMAYCKGVKHIFTGSPISLVVAFKGLNVISTP